MSRNFPKKTEGQQVSTQALNTSSAVMEMQKRTSTTVHLSEMADNLKSLQYRVLLKMWSKRCLTEPISESAKLYGHFGK